MTIGKVQMLMQINASKASTTKDKQLKIKTKGSVKKAKKPDNE